MDIDIIHMDKTGKSLEAINVKQGRSQRGEIGANCQCNREVQQGPRQDLLPAYAELKSESSRYTYIRGFLQSTELFRSASQSPARAPWSELMPRSRANGADLETMGPWGHRTTGLLALRTRLERS